MQAIPSNERTPHAIQMTKLIPTDPVRTNKPDGDTNIPDPEQTNNVEFILQ